MRACEEEPRCEGGRAGRPEGRARRDIPGAETTGRAARSLDGSLPVAIVEEGTMARGRMRAFGAAALAALFAACAVAGCGGGGSGSGAGGSGSAGTAHVLLTDDPVVSVNGTLIDEVNVEIAEIAFEDTNGNRTPFQLTNSAGQTTNLLALTNSNDWIGSLSVPRGLYRAIVLRVNPANASVHERGAASNAPLRVNAVGPNADLLVVRLTPPLPVGAGTVLVVIDWMLGGAHNNPGTLVWDAASSTYVLNGVFRAFVPPRGVPIPVRAVLLRVDQVDAAAQSIYGQFRPRSATRIRVGASGATLRDVQGNTIALTDIRAGDFILAGGAIDDRADLIATVITKVPAPGQPPHHGHAFALGVIRSVDTAAQVFVLDTPHRGPVPVRWTAGTQFFSVARPQPGQPPAAPQLRGAPDAADVGKHAGAGGGIAQVNGVPGIDALRVFIER